MDHWISLDILSPAFILISNPEELGLSKEVNREGYSKCPD